MNTLYSRRNPVFEPILSGGVLINPNSTCILDMRLHWNSGMVISNPPQELKTLLESSGGVSLITQFNCSSGELGPTCSIGLAAKHPSADVYYSTYIVRSASLVEYGPYIVQEDQIYTYNTTTEPYYVIVSTAYVNREIQQPLTWSGGYILMDLGINTSIPYGTRVEPFNTVFDPVVNPNNLLPIIKWYGANSVVSSASLNSVFTNNPKLTSGGSTVNITPAYNLELNGDNLSFTRNYTSATNSSIGIRAINDITPTNGNINITIA